MISIYGLDCLITIYRLLNLNGVCESSCRKQVISYFPRGDCFYKPNFNFPLGDMDDDDDEEEDHDYYKLKPVS